MSGIRRDIASLGPAWSETLRWYARAIKALDDLPIAHPNSWRFLAAIHGFDEDLWRQSGILQPGDVVPASLQNDTFANQCQHGSWYFLPWHRAYLWAFEAIVADKVRELGGPDDWALPYWNYLDSTNPQARSYPQEFRDALTPDGLPNPLSRPLRRNATRLERFDPRIRDINLLAMTELDFLVGQDGTIGFGGGVTGFSESGEVAGDLEANPHNPVHVMIGGLGAGFMSDPDMAALDPIFWVHHCNIDRLWEAWMNASGRTMVQDQSWRDGPFPRRFLMPGVGSGAAPVVAMPVQTLPGGFMHPVYDDTVAGTGVVPRAIEPEGVSVAAERVESVEVIGATDAALNVHQEPAVAAVRLDAAPVREAVETGPMVASESRTRLYLQLENITGPAASSVIDVFVNLPAGQPPESRSEYRADTLYLFGLRKASDPDGNHAGNGLGFTIDITELARRLSAAGEFDPERIAVSVFPVGEAGVEQRPVRVGRVSVLKRSG